MKFNKLTNKIKLHSALIATTTIVGGAFLSVPLLLSTNNKIISNNSDYKNFIDQDNNKSTGSSDFSSQPTEIRDFFAVFDNKKIYTNMLTHSLFVVVTQDDGFDVLYAWGKNSSGQLGLGVGDKTSRSHPTLVPGLPSNSKITHVAASWYATTVVINDNQIWVTGGNWYDEHGDPDLGDIQIFVQNTKWEYGAVKSLYAGARHRIVTTDDKVLVWGENQYGELGTGNTDDQKTPFDLTDKIKAANSDWKFGKFYTNKLNTAMLVNGQLYMWGYNSEGQLGNGNKNHVMTPPNTPINFNGRKIKKYSLGDHHSIVLLENGELYSWGINSYGQLGINSDTSPLLIPTKVTTMLGGAPISGVTDVFTVGSASYIQIGNKIYSCGENLKGALAQGPTIVNNKIFSPVILDSSAEINSIYTIYSGLIVNLNSGLYMAGSNSDGQFANGVMNTDTHHTLTQVSPFGVTPKLTSKRDNTKYKVDDVVADLKSKTTSQEIRDALAKYVDGIDSIPLESALSYAVPPTASQDNTKVTMTLKTNRSFGANDAKIKGDFDFPITITNFWFEESALIIKNKPAGVHTGNIRTKLNPNPGSVPSPLWASEIIDMTKFPGGTTFTSITDDNVTIGTGNGTYTGNIVASNYYVPSGPTGTSKTFPFVLDGLTKVDDSKLATQQSIHPDLNIDNIKIELPNEQPIKDEYLSMFVEKDTFPTGTIFKTENLVVDAASKTFSCDVLYDKYYKDGLLQTNGTKAFTFSNFKTIKISEINFRSFAGSGINSANIDEKLITNGTVNKDVLSQIAELKGFFPDTIFTIKGTPTLDLDAGTYSGTITASKSYKDWAVVTSPEDFHFTFTELQIVKDSEIVYKDLPAGFHINNTEGELRTDGTANIRNETLNKLIDIDKFPPNTTFIMGDINKDMANNIFTFDMIPSRYYMDGVAISNTTTAPKTYSVIIKLNEFPVNLGLIIGLSVGGVALVAIVLLCIWWKLRRKRSELYIIR